MTTDRRDQPSIQGRVLLLRPFTLGDAATVQTLAGAPEIAATTLTVPHPYGDGVAEAWIETHAPGWAAGELATFAMVTVTSRELVGAIGLSIRAVHARAELGYWVGVPYWNHGYATEASTMMLRFGFEELGLNRIHTQHFRRNPASGRVMQKIGMSYEGRLRQHIRRWEVFDDAEQYGILAEEWRGRP